MKDSTKTKKKVIALAGNPNVGKSIFFHYLSNIYVDVSNYPGTTVEITSADLDSKTTVKDTPGIYGVSSFNDEERAARDVILDCDEIVNIVSAITLERDLFLTKQLIDMGKPLILCINQMDEAKSRNIKINIEKLSQLLGVPVFPTVAINQEGLAQVKEAILTNKAKTGNIDPVLKNELTEILKEVTNQSEALLLLEGDLVISEKYNLEPKNKRDEIYHERRKQVNEIVEQVLYASKQKKKFSNIFSNLLIDPLWGTIIAILIGFLFLYQFLGIWVGEKLIDFTEKKIMITYYEPTIREITGFFFPVEVFVKSENKVYSFPYGFVKNKTNFNKIKQIDLSDKEFFFGPSDYIEIQRSAVNPQSSILDFSLLNSLGTILSGKYGLLTLTVTYLFGLLLPLVIAFYTSLAILEDTGYLPRLAVLVDSLLSKIGINGRAIIPLILGLGCVTMASVTTRILNTKREKIIVLTILGIAIPCSAQLGVIQSLLARHGGFSSWLVWLGVIAIVLVTTGFLMNKFLSGKSTPLLIDLPPLRFPRFKNIFYKAKTKVIVFMAEAVPAFFLAAFIVSLMQVTGFLSKVIALFKPISVNLLHLPEEVSTSFILGMVRRDFGAFGLTELPMTGAQVTVASIVLTLFVPCIAAVAVMAKEQSWKVAGGIWIVSMLISITIGSIVARIIGA